MEYLVSDLIATRYIMPIHQFKLLDRMPCVLSRYYRTKCRFQQLDEKSTRGHFI